MYKTYLLLIFKLSSRIINFFLEGKMNCTKSIIAAIIFIFIGTGLFYYPDIASAQEAITDTSFYQLFQQTVDGYHNEQFDEAIQNALQIRQEYPNEPAGVFGLLITYQIIMRNYRVKLYQAKFDSLLDLAIKLSKKAVKRNKKDGRNYFYLGCAYGSRSINFVQQGKWFDAFKDGSKVLTNFKKAVAYSPDFYDAYHGLGLYKYWLGAKAKVMRFLPFARDSRQEGIHQMKIAIEKGRFLNVDAKHGLYTAYFHEGEYEKALELSDQLYEWVPNNPSLLYRRGRIYQAMENWTEALQTFAKLDTILKSTRYKSLSYQVDCLYQMAKCQYHLENYLETQRLCQQAILLENKCDFSKELSGPLEKYSTIKKELHKLHDQINTIMLTQANDSQED